jgi:exodeoxyribonuclease VII small subunit
MSEPSVGSTGERDPGVKATGERDPGVKIDPSIKDFEAAIAELEAIVKQLEEGDLTLERSLALYERGVQLSRFCHARLEEAEHRIEVLNERGELGPAPANMTPRNDVIPGR